MSKRFKDSKTKLVGIYSMAVKVIRLDFLIGCNKIKLPQYIWKSRFINALADCDTNMCFWACLALAEGCRKDRWKTKAKELFKEFYSKDFNQNYKGFNLNELEEYEKFNKKYAINVVNYVVDKKQNTLNMLENHQKMKQDNPFT